MKQNYFKQLAFLLLLLCGTTVSAQEFEVGGIHFCIWHLNNQDKYAMVTTPREDGTAVPGYSGNVVIPEKVVYEGVSYNVSSIDMWAFANCTDLTGVTIPNSVKEIHESAFRGCTSLNNLTLPAGLTLVGKNILYESGWYNNQPDGLLYLDGWLLGYKGELPPTGLEVAEGTKGVAGRAFEKCDWLSTVTIPGSVSTICYQAFNGCENLTDVNMSAGLKEIQNEAFYACHSLMNARIPNTVESIGSMAFLSCTSLMDINIPASVTEIGGSAFYNTGWYNNQPGGLLYLDGWLLYYKGEIFGDVTVADGTKYIGTYALGHCVGITGVNLPNSVVGIGDGAFNSSGIVNITIPNGVERISYSAFSDCFSLASVTIPASVTIIEQNAFNGCTSLKDVRIEDSPVPLLLESIEIFNSLLETLYLGRDVLCEYNFYNSSLKSLAIGEFTTFLPSRFSPDVMESISVAAGNKVYDSREGCNAIIETATNTLLLGCKNTKIPKGVAAIGESAFYGCEGLKNIEIPNGVTSIGADAFSNCSALENVTIPNGVTSIGLAAFSSCSALENVTIPNSVTSIDPAAFADCTALEYITIPNGVTYIGEWTFGESGLKSITIPGNVETVTDGAFAECEQLKDVTIRNGVKTLGSGAFGWCTALESVTIGGSVTSIGEYVFDDCESLSKIYLIGDTPASVAEDAFIESHYQTAELYVPLGTLEVYKAADVWKNFLNIKEHDVTAIESVVPVKDLGVCYDMNGRIVEYPANGVYILNGQKYLIK